jgi:hypothetical protein
MVFCSFTAQRDSVPPISEQAVEIIGRMAVGG